jgi:hypothetical protein
MNDAVRLYRSPNAIHKFMAVFPDGKKVRFGRKGYSDYTIHGDAARMKRYLTRHRSRESWGRSGKYTAGFWSRWLLWSKPSLKAALTRTSKVLGKKIVMK